MKDYLGNELELGDFVIAIYYPNTGEKSLYLAQVVGFSKQKVEVCSLVDLIQSYPQGYDLKFPEKLLKIRL